MSLSKPPVILTEEQKVIINENYDKIDRSALTALVFNDPKLDSRSVEGKAVAEYLASFGKSSKVPTKPKKGPFELTEYHKQFILSNIKDMEPLEMLKVLFPGMKNYTLLSSEGKAIYKFRKENSDEEVFDMWDEPAEDKEYKPPLNFMSMLGRANTYIPNQFDSSKPAFDLRNLKKSEEKNLKAMMAHMKTVRFRYQASVYDKKAERVLFESTFIRFVADKASDLTPEEVDTYITAAAETLNIRQLEKRIMSMEKMVDDLLSGIDDEGERKKLSLNHVELVNTLRTKHTDSKKLLQSLLDSLDGSRSEKMNHRMKQTSSIINLLDAWIKEESRLQIIALTEKEKKEDAELVEKFESMDDIKILIAGMTKDEAAKG